MSEINKLITDLNQNKKALSETKQIKARLNAIGENNQQNIYLKSQVDRTIKRLEAEIERIEIEINLCKKTNVVDLKTDLTHRTNKFQIQHALKNLIETYGRDAVIEANQSMKLTRKPNKTIKKAS